MGRNQSRYQYITRYSPSHMFGNHFLCVISLYYQSILQLFVEESLLAIPQVVYTVTTHPPISHHITFTFIQACYVIHYIAVCTTRIYGRTKCNELETNITIVITRVSVYGYLLWLFPYISVELIWYRPT